MNKTIRTRASLCVLLLAGVTLSSCKANPHRPDSMAYSRSAKVTTYPLKATVVEARRLEPVTEPAPAPVQKATVPLPEQEPVVVKPRKPSSGNPLVAIRTANQDARRAPDENGFENARMKYDFEEGALYEVYTGLLRLTDIQLQPGEKIMGKPAAGDTVRWILGVNESMANGQPVQHILVKPTAPDLQTSLIINTNRRTYLLELSSHEHIWMAGVRWRYPQDEQKAARAAVLARQQAQLQQQQETRMRQQVTASDIDISNLNFAYSIQTSRSHQPVWTPTKVFDDGRRVFIRFPKSRRQYEAPALFVLSGKGEPQLVNYRVQNDYYIVDRLFALAELRVGQSKPETVRIIRAR